jgi:hypothetical protein
MNIKDYLHLYMGCAIADSSDNDFIVCDELDADFLKYLLESPRLKDFRLVLRPLSDISKEEVADLMGIEGFIQRGNFCSPFFQCEYRDLEEETHCTHLYIHQLDPKHFLFLLSKYFDLFGLINAGLALDKTKTFTPNPTV